MKNYRPISLLNVEYKIITKTLVNKIMPFMESFVDPEQAAAIQDRNIQTHNHNIKDLITLAKCCKDNNCILSVDQQKAFDRVAHDWLFKVLEAANFRPKIRRWIRMFHANASSLILVDRTLPEPFVIGR